MLVKDLILENKEKILFYYVNNMWLLSLLRDRIIKLRIQKAVK